VASKRHKGDTKSFDELTFAEQAKSITAMINNLEAATKHHIDHSLQRTATRDKCIAQVERLLARVRDRA
jgi:hypothetical protein